MKANRSYPKPYKYKVRKPEKYDGDPTNVWIRSSWERRFFIWCERNPSVVKWSSENTVIWYYFPVDGKTHRYFVDVKITYKMKDDSLKTAIIEIKPFAQTKPPLMPKKKTRSYYNAVRTYIMNQSKWKAAKEYAEKRGYGFMIITEKELFKEKN